MKLIQKHRMPAIKGLIDRRILINYHVDPAVLQRILPSPFEPLTVKGMGIAGVCLIRLKHVRPLWLPFPFGIRSENAAYRFAVKWSDAGEQREGVYIPRRDSSSWLNRAAGGRVFRGVHRKASFTVHETADELSVDILSADRGGHISYRGRVATDVPEESVFSTLQEASEFFEKGSCGYSPCQTDGEYEGLELRVPNWLMEPMATDSISCSFFDDTEQFPTGSIGFDGALLMRHVEHEWHSLASIHGSSNS